MDHLKLILTFPFDVNSTRIPIGFLIILTFNIISICTIVMFIISFIIECYKFIESIFGNKGYDKNIKNKD